MPRGEKSAYTDKKKRQAEHIDEGYKKEGVSDELAEARAWATVNKQDGGGKKSGSGRAGARKTSAKRTSKSTGTARKTSGTKRTTRSASARRKAPRKTTRSASKRKS